MLLVRSLFALFSLRTAALAVWPEPTRYEHGSSVLWLTPTFETAFEFPAPSRLDAFKAFLTFALHNPWEEKLS